jgi:uncharacterized SAM-binding protein YcdF (DUF218 family)
MKYDAIAVIARGIYPDGTLYPNSIFRVEHAIDLFRRDVAQTIILSGKWSSHDKRRFVTTESEAMYVYAKTLGVGESNMICEPHSSTTIENILNIKDLCQDRGIQTLVLVCGKDHEARVKYLSKKIFGNHIAFTISISKRTRNPYEIVIRPVRELFALVFFRNFLKDMEDGDHRSIRIKVNEFNTRRG